MSRQTGRASLGRSGQSWLGVSITIRYYLELGRQPVVSASIMQAIESTGLVIIRHPERCAWGARGSEHARHPDEVERVRPRPPDHALKLQTVPHERADGGIQGAWGGRETGIQNKA